MPPKHHILSLYFLLVLLFFSCGKPEEGRIDETFDTHPSWTDSNPESFWDKQADGGTTINL